MPPWIWIVSAAAWKYASEQYDFAMCAADEQFLVSIRGAERRVVHRGARELDLDEHVGALVLDGLEGADRTAELETRPRIVGRHLEAALRAARLFGGERHHRESQYPLEPRRRVAARRSASPASRKARAARAFA